MSKNTLEGGVKDKNNQTALETDGKRKRESLGYNEEGTPSGKVGFNGGRRRKEGEKGQVMNVDDLTEKNRQDAGRKGEKGRA